jgi:YVTN family beta-propeller protein
LQHPEVAGRVGASVDSEAEWASNISSINVGTWPYGAVFDGGNGYVYVPNQGSDNVSVVNGSRVVGTLRVGNSPGSAVYGGANGYVYVMNSGSDNVSVLHDLKVVGAVNVGSDPMGAAYDGGNGYTYVPNSGSDNLSVISGTDLVATLSVGAGPADAAYDEGNGCVYVPNADAGSVTVINGTDVIGSVNVGIEAVAAAYDDGNGYVYVVNYGSNSVSVIDGSKVIGTVRVGNHPNSVVYDNTSGFVYVVNDDTLTTPSNVTIIQGTGVIGSASVGVNPLGASYDSGNGDVYVMNDGSDYVTAIRDTKDLGNVSVGFAPGGAAYDPRSGILYVPNYYTDNVSTIFTWPAVTVTEGGLPSGVTWWVNVTGGPTEASAMTDLSFNEPDGSYTYSVSTSDTSYAAPGGSFTVNGTPVYETVNFSRVTYPLTFIEVGLPSGTNWSVTIEGVSLESTTDTIVVGEQNGTYAYLLGEVPGWTTVNFSGSVRISGAAVFRTADWNRVKYTVSFFEIGLVGAGWWLNVTWGVPTFTSQASLSVSEPNGSYTYSLSASNKTYAAPGGSFTVHGGPLVEQVEFTELTYAVTFSENGLPPGASWTVGLDETQHTSRAATIGFVEPNGTYLFVVNPAAGYTASIPSGTITVSGANITEKILFTVAAPPTYEVTFIEAGLPSETPWSVTFNDVPESGKGDLPFIGIENGTYAYTIGSVLGYTATPSGGSLHVAGPTNESVDFTSSSSVPAPATFLGLPAMDGYGVLGGVIIAILAATTVVALSRTRGGKASP